MTHIRVLLGNDDNLAAATAAAINASIKTAAVEQQTKETKRMKERVPTGPGAVTGASLDTDTLWPVTGPKSVSLMLRSA